MSSLTLEEITVLIVEPSSTQRKIISRLISEAGITKVLEAKDGASALEQLINKTPDLVISSLYLPDMSGTELVHAIRETDGRSSTAFMLISSETRFRYLDPIRQAGAVGILPKPFTIEELKIALTTTLDFLDSSDIQLDEFDADALKVLVVDDSNLARKHISRVLNGMGINMDNIDTANDGVEALALVNENYYDFVVSDYNMPNMDGGELVDQIRNASSQSSIPILMVTSEADENRLAAVQNAGVSAICDKPFEPDTVHKLINQFMS